MDFYLIVMIGTLRKQTKCLDIAGKKKSEKISSDVVNKLQ